MASHTRRTSGSNREFVTAENINELLANYEVPEDFDLFSLDIDGNDYWVWEALKYQPSVVVIEYNAAIAMSESKTIPDDPAFSWSAHGRTSYYGASLLALKRLGERKGYVLVYANGVNVFFVRSSLVPNRAAFVYERIYSIQGLSRRAARRRGVARGIARSIERGGRGHSTAAAPG